jgi:negative regulator of flagellin synthesis FlgM
MKIDGNRPNPEAVTTTRADQVQSDKSSRTGRAPDRQSDRVQVSSAGQLATEAAAAASNAPDIRQDKVAAARKALAAGKVGTDVARLADKMIDSMLGK